ncbi:MAG: hypothetical protein LBQ03_00050 [Puniceicoccales bacterium]|nr:hypothetical protein [Puniceicoccales bacterium]
MIAVRANDVGQRGGINSKLIFIDCGCTLNKQGVYGKILMDEENPGGQRLGELFTNIFGYGILVTHNHKDHTNLIETIVKKGGRQKYFIVKPMSKKAFLIWGKLNINNMLISDWLKFCSSDFPRIESSLGPRVRVVPMRPEKWENNRAQNAEHDFNIMYLVEFAGRRILFPGDVSPQFFTQIMNNPKYAREMASVDFLVLPHHGSNQAGELSSFHIIHPEMCIICSNPIEKHHLPWSDVSGFSFKNGKGVEVKSHAISTRSGNINAELPIFVTGNTVQQGYYELVIEADGTAKLFYGPVARLKNIWCFRSL